MQFSLVPQLAESSTSRLDLGAFPTPSVLSVLMQSARVIAREISLPEHRSLGQYPAKNTLKKYILLWLKRNSLGWSKYSVLTLGLPFVHTLGDALWYIDRDHETLKHRGCPVPTAFQQFSGYRILEKQQKRKIDETFLTHDSTKAHSLALFNLALSSYLKKDVWKSVYAAILALAGSLQKYSLYLTNHAKRVSCLV